MVFKALQVERDEAKIRVELSDADAGREQARQWFDLMSRMDMYIKSLAWFSKSRCKHELRVFLESGCSYRKAARTCGVSEKWLYKVVWQAALVLERRFDEVLRAIRRGNFHDVEQAFRTATGDFSSLFDCVVRNSYQPGLHGGVGLESCSEELCFLRRVMEMEDDMVGLDRSRMEHLLFILFDQDSRYALVRQYLFQCLEGRWGVDETLERLAEHEASRRPVICDEEA